MVRTTVEQVINEMHAVAHEYAQDEGGLDLFGLCLGVQGLLDLDTSDATMYRLMALAQGVEATMIGRGDIESVEDVAARSI